MIIWRPFRQTGISFFLPFLGLFLVGPDVNPVGCDEASQVALGQALISTQAAIDTLPDPGPAVDHVEKSRFVTPRPAWIVNRVIAANKRNGIPFVKLPNAPGLAYLS